MQFFFFLRYFLIHNKQQLQFKKINASVVCVRVKENLTTNMDKTIKMTYLYLIIINIRKIMNAQYKNLLEKTNNITRYGSYSGRL